MHVRSLSLIIAIALGVHCVSAHAAPADCPALIAEAVENYHSHLADASAARNLELAISIHGGTGASCLVSLILGTQDTAKKFQIELPQLVAAFQQGGSNVGSSGSTNLVSKGATAKVLSVASEFGALTETTSNQTVTLTGTLGGLPVLLGQKGVVQVCSGISTGACIGISTVNELNRFSYGVVFNTTQNSTATTGTVTATPSTGTAQEATFTASGQTLNSVTAKAVLINGQAPNQKSVVAALEKVAVKDNLVANANALTTARQQFEKDCPDLDAPPNIIQPTPLAKWQKTTLDALVATTADQAAESVWKNSAAGLISALAQECDGTYLKDALAYATAFGSSQLANNTFYEALRAAPELSLEYDYNTPANQPTNSTVRLIAQINKNGWTGSLNAAGSFYNSTPSSSIPSAGKVRDFQVSAEGAYNFNQLKNSAFLGDSTASLAYYYQDQTSPAILNATPSIITGLPSTATQVFAKRGVINVAQAKFAFIPRKSSINIPVSVTWSNRTELVTHPEWRGQVGISYSFDSLFSALGK
jgi:hypothetical protein